MLAITINKHLFLESELSPKIKDRMRHSLERGGQVKVTWMTILKIIMSSNRVPNNKALPQTNCWMRRYMPV